jgi:hypothetical protein
MVQKGGVLSQEQVQEQEHYLSEQRAVVLLLSQHEQVPLVQSVKLELHHDAVAHHI